MAENKKSFLLYCDLIHTVKKMPKEKAGELFMHILEYVNDLEPNTDDLIIQLTFEPIRQSLKRDLEKYERIRLKNKENADKRWNKNNTTECDRIQPNAKNADNDNDNVSDSDILLKKETKEENLSKENPIEIFPQSESVEPGAEERKKVAPKKERFKPPTVQEVQDYCNERQNGIQAYTFVNFYQSKGWKVGNQPMKDWKAAIRTWEQTNKQNGITNTTNTGFSNKGSVSNGKIQGRSIVADRISQHLARNSESGNHTIDIEANIVR